MNPGPDNILRLVVSVDVEEEGLFSGKYARKGDVKNVSLLPNLAGLTREYGFPLTLFCSYSVFADPKARDILSYMREDLGAEIGAHLHHWSTPPYEGPGGADMPAGGEGPPTRTDKLDPALLRARLRALLDIGRDFSGNPLTSFRMGRWDLKSCVRPILAQEGILVDSSVAPLRFFKDGPDHFLSLPDPFWAKGTGERPLLEVPITQIPLFSFLPDIWYRLGRALPLSWQTGFIDCFRGFSALSANPLWHNDLVMRLAAKLHVARGGRVLSLFWHSSEMMPQGSPHIPDQKAADRLLERIRSYFSWLKMEFQVQGMTMSSLYGDPLASSFPMRPKARGDW